MSNPRSTTNDYHLARNTTRLLMEPVLSCQLLHGGDLSEVVRLRLGSGKDVVAKSGPYPEREGRMLRALADANAPVPLPYAYDPHVLVLEDLGPESPPSDLAWRALGTNLRALHRTKGDRYGWGEDYAFGEVRIHNGWSNDWANFWFERRLVANTSALPADVAQRLETLEARISDILPDHPPPALLHGDLWSGNVHFTAGGEAYLIDPASYFGHAEVDLAMLTLFGAPPKAFWDAYGDLDDGWGMRRHAYQLWPALVHLRLFGASYRSLVERLMAPLEADAP